MLGNIIERENTAPTPPSAPRASTASTSGFPTITHRSLRPKRSSAFAAASARQAKDTGVGRAVNPVDIPTIASSRASAGNASLDQSDEAGPSTQRGRNEDEYTRIQREIGNQNQQRVEGMTEEERAEEIRDLEERFGSSVLVALRKRAMQRQGKGKAAQADNTGSQAPPLSATNTKAAIPVNSAGGTNVPSTSAPETRRKSVRFDTPPSPAPPPESDLKSTYFPNTPSEPDKLAWLQPPSSSAPSQSSLRFDLSGHLLSSSQQEDLPTHLGLHHHGDQPDLAGYTLGEIMWLCRSTVHAQRVGMMGLLTKVIGLYVLNSPQGLEDDEVRHACEEEKVCEKAVDLAVEIMQAVKGVTLLQTAIELLYTALGGPTWNFDHTETIRPFFSHPDAQGKAAKLDRVPFESLLPRLSELLTIPDFLAPISIAHLLLILRRAAAFSREMAETILALLPSLLHVHVTRRPWPPQPGKEPLLAPLQLMGDLIASSRLSAIELVNARLPGSILRFCVLSTWPEDDDLGVNMCAEVLRVYTGLARYGLASGTARSAYDIWATLGGYVSDNLESDLAQTYFGLVEAWITCAIDPHRTTPEHDLTWTQIAGLGWADEAIRAIERLTGDKQVGSEGKRVGILSAALGVSVAWTRGLGINGVKGGEKEKEEVRRRLRSSGLLSSIQRIISSASEPTSPDRRVLLESLKLQNLLHTKNDPLLFLQREDPNESWTALDTATGRMTAYEFNHAHFRSTQSPTTSVTKAAFDLLFSFMPGEEPLALDLLDDLLNLDWPTLLPDLASSIKAVQHPDSITLLRPLLQHAILPDVTDIIALSTPHHLYLKASGALRPSAPAAPLLENGRKPPGLPLNPSDLFHPIDELLHSADSAALAQAPRDWDPSETQIVRATMVFLRLALGLGVELGRSELIFGLMKVYMLEHQTGGMVNTGESEVFRDDIVTECLRSLVKGLTGGGSRTIDAFFDPSRGTDETAAVKGAEDGEPMMPGLEIAARPFLGLEPFYQFYTDLVSLFENTSFGDPTFAQILLPPLSMSYPADYRKLVWSNPNVLRLLRTSITDVPLEIGEAREGLRVFYEPIEQDPEVLAAMGQAVVRGWVGEQHHFFWSVAIYHLRGFFRQEEADESDEKGKALGRLRKGLREAILSCGKAQVVGAMEQGVGEPWMI